MKRSEITQAQAAAAAFFKKSGWALPPEYNWDITDFGLGNFNASGLVLVNLAEEAEYCEKIMYGRKGQVTPAHYHKKKKEDIICRNGVLTIRLWLNDPATAVTEELVEVKINGKMEKVPQGKELHLKSGERITIPPYLWHEFFASSEECMTGEVSTANDDVNDNFFSNPEIGRFSEIIED